jgi:hypothetical protein
MVDYELRGADGLLIIRPKGSLEAGDFQRITQESIHMSKPMASFTAY